jgi:FKBP-type peptidyl-prolyl cis-trans isomerase SlyD
MTQVIAFDYVLTDSKGTELDNSKDHGPLAFFVGSQHIIPGLEKELIGLKVGDAKKVSVLAIEAYGEVRADLLITVQRTQFPEEMDIKLGDQFQINETPDAPVFKVEEIDGEDIKINGNHPLAGVDLTFDVKITHVREATDEEEAHGHAHGADGTAGHHH